MESKIFDGNIIMDSKFTREETQEFETGAHRDRQEGKGRYDLIPASALMRLASHYELGGSKYGDNNWKKGMPSSRYYDSAMRHLVKYKGGMRDEDHLAAVLWNVIAIMWNEENYEEGHDLTAGTTDDRLEI